MGWFLYDRDLRHETVNNIGLSMSLDIAMIAALIYFKFPSSKTNSHVDLLPKLDECCYVYLLKIM